jgi:hypothetical protein
MREPQALTTFIASFATHDDPIGKHVRTFIVER